MNSHAEYKLNPFLAMPAIAGLLGTGRLNLFLGAGVSKGFGLPDWTTLIARILSHGGDAAFLAGLQKKSTIEQTKLIDPLDDGKADYLTTVHKALYADVESTLLEQLPRSPLLLAVAALLTGSCRGRIQNVFTYNYDDLLEQYLRMLGYAVRVRTSPTDFSTWADVEINHVHGHLPQSWKVDDKPVELILSEKSYRSRRAGIDEGWSSYVEHSIYSKAALFMGLSGDDYSILDLLKRGQMAIDKTASRPRDYYGYWLMTPDAYHRNEAAIIEVGMCPIPIEKDQLARFVFGVCQAALPK